MGKKFSLLHLLSHEQQLEIYREHANLSSRSRQAQRPDFEVLPPEIRLMVFVEFIRDHEQNSEQNWRRSLENMATGLCQKCIEEQLFETQPRQPGGLLFRMVKSIATACIRLVILGLMSPGIYLYIWTSMAWQVWQIPKRIYSPAKIPRTDILHEALVIRMLFVSVVMLSVLGCLLIPLFVVVLFLPDDDQVVEVDILKFYEEQDDEVYDLPIFYLNQTLSAEALKAARCLKYNPPQYRLRRKFIERLYERANAFSHD